MATKGTLKFGGHRFVQSDGYNSKAEAEAKAESIRKTGQLARVISRKGGTYNFDYYVYRTFYKVK